MPRRAILTIVGLALVGGAVVLLVRGERPDRARQGTLPPPKRAVPRVPPRAPVQLRGPLGARVIRPVLLRESPGGRALRRVGTRTGFGSPRVFAIVKRRGEWLGVLSQYRRNSRLAWIAASAVVLLRERYALEVDLSARRLLVRRDGRVARRMIVAVGRPGNETPTGRFGITDALIISKPRGAYGCCALALTGRQPNVSQGWTGGDRIAIHGTSSSGSIGTAVSGGCMRASERDMRWLLSHIPLGAQLRIRA